MFGKSKAIKADLLAQEVKQAGCDNERGLCRLLEAIATSPVPVYENPKPLRRAPHRRRPGDLATH